METRRTRGKRIKYEDTDFQAEIGEISDSNDPESLEDLRKSRNRVLNKDHAKRMTILDTWSDFWSHYTTREGEAYPKKEVLSILKKSKKIACPIESCTKVFTTFGGLRYHYARCNIEHCFKCNVCKPPFEGKTRGDLVRHMVRSHHAELPTLNAEQQEIANSFLTGSGRNDKGKRRTNPSDNETQMNCRNMVKSYYDLLESTFEPTHFAERPYRGWQSTAKDWELIVHNSERNRYIPPERESPYIKTSPTSWLTLKAGDSLLLDSNSYETNQSQAPTRGTLDSIENVIFFTGGLSTTSAWLPKPLFDTHNEAIPELLAIAVKSCSMDKAFYYKDCKDIEGCIQFWTLQLSTSDMLSRKPSISFMIGHSWGHISEMCWCPLGASWEQATTPQDEDRLGLPRVGLLAIACGDGQIRLVSVPHLNSLSIRSSSMAQYSEDIMDSTPIYRVRPVGCLAPPGAGQSTDYQTPSCTSLCWNLEDNQRLIVAGYSNGSVALFDLSNYSPILYSTFENFHVYRPFKTWFAHGLPVNGVALLSNQPESAFVATGGRDRQLKIWNPMDLNTCLVSDRAPITHVIWDYRLRGIVSSTEAAFTSFQNRVSYRYPAIDGTHTTITIAVHRATVWGLANSVITSALATSDEAGEVLVAVYGRPIQKKDRNHSSVHSIFTALPRSRRSPMTNNDRDLLANGNLCHQSNSIDSYQAITGIAEDRKPIEPENSCRLTREQGEGDTIGDAIDNNELVITQMQSGGMGLEATSNLELELDENNEEDVYGYAERQVANKPARFLLPIDHPAVETYADFKHNFGLEYVEYNQACVRQDEKLPESCLRASDVSKIYCDRVCDYPYSSIRHVSFSPNTKSFSYLLSVSHIGLCRVDKIKVLEQMYKHNVDELSNQILQKRMQRNNP